MATIWFAQAGIGNIDDANKWKTLPSGGTALTWANLANGDTLSLNGKTMITIPSGVNIDAGAGTSVTVSTDADGAGATGGNLVSAFDCTVRGNIVAGTTTPITTATSAKRLTVIGNVTGGVAQTIPGISLSGGHSLTLTGNVTGGVGANTAYGVYCNCTSAQGGSTVITGTVSGGSGAATSKGVYNANSRAVTFGSGSTIQGGNGAATSYGFHNASTGDFTVQSGSTIQGGDGAATAMGIRNDSTGAGTITATIQGGSTATGNYAIYNASTGALTITGNITGGRFAGIAGAILNTSTAAITVTGDLSSGSAARTPAIYNASTGVVTVTGNIIHDIVGGNAVYGNIRWTPGIGHSQQRPYDATHYYYSSKTIPKADVKLGVDGNGAGAPETGTLVAGAGGGGSLVGNSVLVSAGG